jgi:hypothetical protein
MRAGGLAGNLLLLAAVAVSVVSSSMSLFVVVVRVVVVQYIILRAFGRFFLAALVLDFAMMCFACMAGKISPGDASVEHGFTQGAGVTAVVVGAGSVLVSEASSELRSSSAAGVVAQSMTVSCVLVVWLSAIAVFFVGSGVNKGLGDVAVVTSFLSLVVVAIAGMLIMNRFAGLEAGEVSSIQHSPLMNYTDE